MKTVTFKVHKADRKGSQTRVLLHQLDPHEKGTNDLTEGPPNSGNAMIKILVTAPGALDFFKKGALVDVTFSERN